MQLQRQPHQVRALLLKNLQLQSRQKCTNICQILTPIICLLFTIIIRNIAISKLPSNSDSIFNQFPTIPQKFNNYTLQDYVPDLVQRRCQQWYQIQVLNDTERRFIGNKGWRPDGGWIYQRTGLLGRVRDTSHEFCPYNITRYFPFLYDNNYYWGFAPLFLTKNQSVNQHILNATIDLNHEQDDTVRHSTAIDSLPDGAITFHSANQHQLRADLKINDIRVLDYHRADGVTRIRFRKDTNESFQSYYLIGEGFLALQHAISEAYINMVAGPRVESGLIYMPFVSVNTIFVDLLVNTVTTVLFPVSLSLLLPVFLYLVVLEKEEKLIQMMRMNGMKMSNYWLVTFLFNFVISLTTNLVFFLFGYFFMESALFHQTGKDVLLVVLLGWVLAQIGMSTFFQVFLASSRAANIIGYLISIWTNLIGATLSIAIYQYPRPLPTALLLYPTFAFNRIFYLIFTECSADRCFGSLASLTSQAKQCIAVLYVSFVVFQLLGMYLYEVVPQEYGTRQPLTFPFKFLTSRFRKRNKTIESRLIVHRQNQDQSAKEQRTRIADIANLSDYPLVVSGLRKVYSTGKVANKGMDLMIQDREVFGLLGPNGAGKTTLISMITGVFEPTEGDCYVGGYSITQDIEKVHLNIGVCPQFDILWPQLTVEEHLYFYTRLRGTKASDEKMMVAKALQQVNLTQFRNFKSAQLSGGMKRRLSVGISMVGDPRVVFLDEPTTGLDPENRRKLWEVLNNCRANRALFLTTHLMEEADALCNRIGIITQGVLRTVGTQQKLKKLYGNGYYLSLNLQLQRPGCSLNMVPTAEYPISSDQSLEQREGSVITQSADLTDRGYLNQSIICDQHNSTKTQQIKTQICLMFPKAVLDREISGFLRFNLGEVVISQVMSKLAKSQIEDIRNNWGLTNSNLEDVFLEVVTKFQKEDQYQDKEEESVKSCNRVQEEIQNRRHSINREEE